MTSKQSGSPSTLQSHNLPLPHVFFPKASRKALPRGAPAGISQLLSTGVSRKVNFRSSGWKIATFKYVSRIEETCSEQLAERTCLENLLRGNRADNLLRATCTKNLLEELAQRNSRNSNLSRFPAILQPCRFCKRRLLLCTARRPRQKPRKFPSSASITLRFFRQRPNCQMPCGKQRPPAASPGQAPRPTNRSHKPKTDPENGQVKPKDARVFQKNLEHRSLLQLFYLVRILDHFPERHVGNI